jgi:hypothetical protein
LLVTHASRASWVPTYTSSCCPLLIAVYSSRRCSRNWLTESSRGITTTGNSPPCACSGSEYGEWL